MIEITLQLTEAECALFCRIVGDNDEDADVALMQGDGTDAINTLMMKMRAAVAEAQQ